MSSDSTRPAPAMVAVRTRVELIRDPPDRTIVGANRNLWTALSANPRRTFAPPGGRLGQRILTTLELDAPPPPTALATSEGPAPSVSAAVWPRKENVARALLPPKAAAAAAAALAPTDDDSSSAVPANSAASIGRLVTYAVLRDVPGDEPTLWVSEEWLADNHIPKRLLFPDIDEQMKNGELPVGTCTMSACGFVELAEVIIECEGSHPNVPNGHAHAAPATGEEDAPTTKLAPYDIASHDNSKNLIQALKSNLLPILRQKSDLVVSLPLPVMTKDAPATAQPTNVDVKLHVMMCGPTMQGVVGEKTTVIVVKQGMPPVSASATLEAAPATDNGNSVENLAVNGTSGVSISIDTSAAVDSGPAENGTREPGAASSSGPDGLLSPDDDWDSASVDSNDTATWLDNLVPSFGQPTGERDVQVEGLTMPVPLSAATEALSLPQTQLKSKTFTALSLSAPYPAALLSPSLSAQDDGCSIILVDWKQMVSARWGNVVSGDWVLVKATSSADHADDTSTGRMVRIFGIEVPASVNVHFRKQLGGSDALCWMSPLLLHNLRAGSPKSPFQISVSILPDPYHRQPPLEAADVLLTRIASPNLNDRDILDAALDGMKTWFEKGTRVVRQGEIIAIALDPAEARLRAKSAEASGEVVTLSENSAAGSQYETVFFKVMSVKSPVQKIQYGDSFAVNPIKTTMTESGVEYMRAPAGVSSYLSGKKPIDLSTVDPQSPAKHLISLISTTLLPSAPGLNLSLTLLLHGPKGVGKRHLIKQCCEATSVNYVEVNCFDLSGDAEAKTEQNLRDKWKHWEDSCPAVVVLRNLEALSKMDKGEEVAGKQPHLATVFTELFKRLPTIQSERNLCPLIVVGTTADPEKLPRAVRGCFRHELRIDAPDEDERRAILHDITRNTPLAPDVRLQALALQTAALNARDLRDMVGRAAFEALRRASGSGQAIESKDGAAVVPEPVASEADTYAAGVCLTLKDFELALERSRKEHADSIGAPKIPSVTWDDVGGLISVKSQIMDTIQLPLEHPELFAGGMKKRSGILLYGPPGTGKTLLAKAVATEFTLNFLSVKGPELLNMYIGESEANVRKVFQRARDARPCVIFFDELDSVAPKRGDKGDSGGVMDRIVSQLLAELDGMSSAGGPSKGDVFVIGATNRPDLLDPALLRPGRFDKLLYLGVSEDHDSQLKIIQALTRKFRLHPDLDLRKVAEKCAFNFTGADFYALCSDSMLKAMVRKISEVDKKIEDMNKEGPKEGLPYPITASYFLDNLATPADYLVEVMEVDFDAAQNELVPSVPMAELERYKRIRQRFEAAAAADAAKAKGEIVAAAEVEIDDIE